MRRLLARLLRAGSDLVRLLGMESTAERDAQIAGIRKQLSAGAANLRTFADVVKFEFDPDRAASMRLSDEIMSAVANAADVLLGVPSWPQKLNGDKQTAQLNDVRNALENGLRVMASSLQQLPSEQQPALLEASLEESSDTFPVAVAKTIDSYGELKMVCAGILRSAA